MNKLKKLISVFLLFILVLTSCSGPNAKKVNSDTVDKFIEDIQALDFESAYECFWKYADRASLDTFKEDCEYIVSRLGVESISICDNEIVTQGERTHFKYNITLHTNDAGDITSSCSTTLIVDDGKTYLTYAPDLLLEDFEHNNIITRVILSGKRGEIFTSDGKVIAQNSYADTVYFNVTDGMDFKSLITQVDSILDLSEDELSDIKQDYDSAVEHNYGAVKIKEFSQGTLEEDIISKLCAVEGVAVDSTSMTYQRYYPYSNTYAHVLGYANSPNEEQAAFISEGNYSPDSVWGKEGIEKAYNEDMLSKNGYAYQLRKDNYEIKRTLYSSNAVNGKDIILTIDSRLQEKAYELVSNELDDDQAAAVVVLNGTTGAVLAKVSGPSYDPNLFSFGISSDDYNALLEDDLAPLYNRVTQGLYPPGSTIKPFTAVAAVDNNICNFYTEFPYTIVDNSWTPENWHWLPINRDEYVEAPITMYKAMVKSDNIYFAWLGLEMGYDALSSYFTKIGIGESVTFDLPTVKSNLINENAERNGTMLADMSFGHGQLLVTPLQLASMYTAFQNDGDILNPYLVYAYGQQSGDDYTTTAVGERSVWKEDVVSPSYIQYLDQMFEGVVEEGTASLLKSKDTTIYAKTGTAIKGDDKDKRISWVVAWTPNSEDNRIVVVAIETPPLKGNVKFTIAKPLLTME